MNKILLLISLLMAISACRESASSDAGVMGGEPAGSEGGTPAGTPAGMIAGMPAGAEGGTPAGAEGGTPAGSEGGTPAGSEGGTPAGMTGGTTPETFGTVKFYATYGSEARNQFPALWRPSIPGYGGNAPLVMMLCAQNDERCMNPTWIHEVTESESNGDPIQGSFGRQVEVPNVPTGDYLLMIFADSERSREIGFGWEDQFPSNGEWGGKVSETDLLWSANDDRASDYYNPAPLAHPVQITTNQVLDLETITLGHFYHRDISPMKEAENGLVVVATLDGLRLIDANTFQVLEVAPNSAIYEHQMVDSQENLLQAEVCGLIKGPNQTVFILYKDQSSGFAVQYNPFTKTQSAGRITFPSATQACRGIYFQDQQGAHHLAVVNAPASRMVGGEEGFWIASFDPAFNQNVNANYYSRTNTRAYQRFGFDDVAYAQGKLYFSISIPTGQTNTALDECIGKHCVLAVDYNANISLPASMDPNVWVVGNQSEAAGNVQCVAENGYVGLSAQMFHDGKNLLFVGGCTLIYVYDLATGLKLDMNGALPGKCGLDVTSFGQGIGQFTLSPDGNTLYALPQTKSSKHFNFKLDYDDNRRQTYNRYMVLPIALNQGDIPAVDPLFVGNDIDGFEGDPGFGDMTPALDPGIDLNIGHLIQYIVGWSGALAGSTPGSASIPVGPELAAGSKMLWVRGSGVRGVSGLGKGGNLVTLSLQAAQPILWPQGDESFYRVWMNGAESMPQWGYDLTPENNDNVATRGIIYMAR